MGTKAENVRPVIGDGTTATPAKFFTCDATSRSSALPDAWANKFIRVVNTGTVGAWFYIGRADTDVCHSAPAAADSGDVTNPQRLGGYLAPGFETQFVLPGLRPAGPSAGQGRNYFVRASGSSAPLAVHLAEG